MPHSELTVLHIDRCVCVDCPFTELKRMARTHALDFDGLARKTGCGQGCGLCRPYIKIMLKTGQTVFTELLTEADVQRMQRGDVVPGRAEHSVV